MLLRAILPFFDSYLMGITAVKLVAGAYLLWIAYNLLSENNKVRSIHHIWGAVKTIIVVDFMMSLSNVLVIAEAAQSAGGHSDAYAFVGLVLSIQAVAFADKGIMKLKDMFPIIIWASASLLGWVGAEMIISDPLLSNYLECIH
jgi:predicted tellurium resistance membrane protein TerC